jgi:hypothetical protein
MFSSPLLFVLEIITIYTVENTPSIGQHYFIMHDDAPPMVDHDVPRNLNRITLTVIIMADFVKEQSNGNCATVNTDWCE